MAQSQDTQQQFYELNVLEQKIARDTSVEESVREAIDDARWQQAQIVHELLVSGTTQKKVAAEWTNVNTGKPYSQTHVSFVEAAWDRFGDYLGNQRPKWSDAYQTVKEKSDEVISTGDRWREMVEARAPKNTRTAERFVQNLQDAPPEVVEAIAQGAREVSESRYRPPKERDRVEKEADAWSKKRVEPIVNEMSKNAIDLLFEQLLEELQDVTEISGEERDRYLARVDEIRTEVEVKYAMKGVG